MWRCCVAREGGSTLHLDTSHPRCVQGGDHQGVTVGPVVVGGEIPPGPDGAEADAQTQPLDKVDIGMT